MNNVVFCRIEMCASFSFKIANYTCIAIIKFLEFKTCNLSNISRTFSNSNRPCCFFHNQLECNIFFSTFKALQDFFLAKLSHRLSMQDISFWFLYNVGFFSAFFIFEPLPPFLHFSNGASHTSSSACYAGLHLIPLQLSCRNVEWSSKALTQSQRINVFAAKLPRFVCFRTWKLAKVSQCTRCG